MENIRSSNFHLYGRKRMVLRNVHNKYLDAPNPNFLKAEKEREKNSKHIALSNTFISRPEKVKKISLSRIHKRKWPKPLKPLPEHRERCVAATILSDHLSIYIQ